MITAAVALVAIAGISSALAGYFRLQRDQARVNEETQRGRANDLQARLAEAQGITIDTVKRYEAALADLHAEHNVLLKDYNANASVSMLRARMRNLAQMSSPGAVKAARADEPTTVMPPAAPAPGKPNPGTGAK